MFVKPLVVSVVCRTRGQYALARRVSCSVVLRLDRASPPLKSLYFFYEKSIIIKQKKNDFVWLFLCVVSRRFDVPNTLELYTLFSRLVLLFASLLSYGHTTENRRGLSLDRGDFS